MKLAAIQHDIVWEQPEANFQQLSPLIAEAASKQAELVLLSEMFSYGFSMDTDKIGEPQGGKSTQFLIEQSARHKIFVGGSLPESESSGSLTESGSEKANSTSDTTKNGNITSNITSNVRNTFVLADPDGQVIRYHKIHPFSHGGENKHYKAGTHTTSCQIGDIRASLSVCYDLRFAYTFWNQAPDVDLYLICANWPAARRHHWMSLLIARAIENQAYVVGVNRIGEGGGIQYSGDSLIVDPQGDILAQAGESKTTLIGEIDPNTVADTREKYRFMADRRSWLTDAQNYAPVATL